MNGIESPILSYSDPIQFSQVPPLDSLRDFYFSVIVTSIFLLEFAAKVLAP